MKSILRNLFALPLIAVAAMQLHAQNTLPFTPAERNDLISVADIWINGGQPEKTNIPYAERADTFSGRYLQIVYPTSTQNEFSAIYRFTVKDAGKYQFHAALIRQKTAHASPVKFRFDEGNWQEVLPVTESRPAWGQSSALNWEVLGPQELAAGNHTLEFFFNQKANNGNWSFMCDGIVGLKNSDETKNRIVKMELTGKAAPGAPLKFQIIASDICPVEAAVMMGDELIMRKGLMIKKGQNDCEIPLSPLLGGNDYKLKIFPLNTSDKTLAEADFSIAPPVSAIHPATLKKAVLERENYTLELDAPQDTTVLAMLFINDQLQEVDTITVKAGSHSIQNNLSDQIKIAAAGHKAKLRFLACPGQPGNQPEISCGLPGTPAPSGLPLNYGMFTDRDHHVHPWYINRQYQYIFDGQPYIPFGGMWCPNTLISKSNQETQITRNLALDRDVIQKLLDQGIDDVYLNLSHMAPLWVRQNFIDMLETNNVNYGYQLNAGDGGTKIPSFFITRNRDDAPKNWKNMILGIFEDGRIKFELPKEYKVLGLLIIPVKNPTRGGEMLSFDDQEGKDNRHNIVDLETITDLSKTREVAIKTKLPLTDQEKVILIPLLESKMHHANLWDPEIRNQLINKNSWIAKLQWGPHLRCFIDPLCNETNMVNGTENLRQYTTPINRDFAAWLEKKYQTANHLSAAWAIGNLTFETASRLIPLRLEEQLYFADPKTGKVYHSELTKSQAWIDYNDMIRETYSAYTDDYAIEMKKMVNVPIINKSVGVHGSREHISRKYLGWDGTGFEIYLNSGVPQEGAGGAAAAEAMASAHSMWQVGTEIGHSFASGNGNVKFFKDEQEIRLAATALHDLGCSGYYFFGIDLKPSNLWGKHSYHDFPEGIKWVTDIQRDFANNPAKTELPSFIYPAGYGWWWWTTRWQSLYDHDQNTIPQSVCINGNEWGYNTDVLPAKFKRVIVNCPYPPFSIKHAPVINAAIKNNQAVVYLGERTDLGSIEELDQYFNTEKISFADGSTAQVLKKLPGVKVLAEEQGKPWAIRKDNLLIVSRTPVKEMKNNANTGFRYLQSDWLQ